MRDTDHNRDRMRAHDESIDRLAQVYDLILRAFKSKRSIAGRGQFGDRARPATSEGNTADGATTE